MRRQAPQHQHPWFVWLALGVDPISAPLLLALRPSTDSSHPTESREERS
jgi:hypothetical protein